MFDPECYELVDFGDGIKVERFGGQLIARESPSVDQFELESSIDSFEVEASFDSRDFEAAKWHGQIEGDWIFERGPMRMLLRQTPSGQVGVFPEQAHNWDWIANHAGLLDGKRAINLFAYTGATTLALAACGVEVTHVDSASSVVSWARANAECSALQERPIRWIVEDALRFMRREIKRGKTYDIFVADPPSFGRGLKKETWKIERDIRELITLAAELCPNPTMAIVSCHTPSIDGYDLAELLQMRFELDPELIAQLPLTLPSLNGRTLPSGECARFVVGA